MSISTALDPLALVGVSVDETFGAALLLTFFGLMYVRLVTTFAPPCMTFFLACTASVCISSIDIAVHIPMTTFLSA